MSSTVHFEETPCVGLWVPGPSTGDNTQPSVKHICCSPGGGGGGDSNIKKVGVFVVSLRGVNFRLWLRLGC